MEARLTEILQEKFQTGLEQATNEQVYYALLTLTKERIKEGPKNEGKRKLYYISAEFLIGKLLSNNLINLGIYDSVKSELEASGKNIGEIEEIELEPSLGNGGLGRLAACFVDSIATLGLNGDGVGLNYHYGLFKQVFDHNLQKETPNPWITPDSWLTKTDVTYPVQFGGFTVQSRLYNIDVVGYNNRTTKLRLFDIETVDESIVGDTIDFNKDDIAKNLTLFLYPDDSDDKGRLLRVYQQYFMVSNAARLILDEAVAKGSNLHDLADYATVQINDTHPSMVIPELIRLSNCTMSFDGEVVLDGINLYINDKEFLTLLGPSGCGKTTTLRIIGGFQKPTSGDVFFDGVRINDVPPHKRKVNTVFQKYALFTHMNIFENVAFGLRISKVPEAELRERVEEALALVNLAGYGKRSVNSLSGGQQQRVAIARAIVNRPQVLLLDEPLGALDLKLRKDMQIELKRIQQQVGITFVYVTHDQEEALTMSDTVVVMNEGRIQQIGTPQDIYNEPKNAFVADFIGESNIIDGIMHEDRVVGMYGKKFPCLDGGFQPNEPVDVVIRPEDIDIVPVEQGQLTGTVTEVTFKGMQYDIIVDFKGFKWLIQTTDFSPVGARIGVKIDPDGFHIMKKSRYSGMFGDYSSYSSEYDELNEGPEEGIEDEE